MLLVFETAVRVLSGKINMNIASAHVRIVFIPEKATKLEGKCFVEFFVQTHLL